MTRMQPSCINLSFHRNTNLCKNSSASFSYTLCLQFNTSLVELQIRTSFNMMVHFPTVNVTEVDRFQSCSK